MLYNKKLNSIKELQAERLALKKSARKKIKNIDQSTSKGDSEAFWAKKMNEFTNSLIGDSKNNELVSIISQVALPYILKQVASKKAKNAILKATSEVFLGYAKWKAISILVGLISDKIKQKKESK
jgi:hypothetical protein